MFQKRSHPTSGVDTLANRISLDRKSPIPGPPNVLTISEVDPPIRSPGEKKEPRVGITVIRNRHDVHDVISHTLDHAHIRIPG